jgi:hypothetical protein
VIVSRDTIRQAVARAMALDSESLDSRETACRAVAQAYGLPVEVVRECVETESEPAC